MLKRDDWQVRSRFSGCRSGWSARWSARWSSLTDRLNYRQRQIAKHVGRLSLSLITALSLVVWAMPGLTYDVQIVPESPQLGDTISVIVQAQNPQSTEPPTVTLDDTPYPAFAVGANRFQVLLPTSPLDAPGRKVVRVTGQEEERNLAVWLRDRSFPTQRINFSPGVASIEGTDYEFDRVAEFKRIVTPDRFWQGPMLRPSQGRVSSVYGVRRYYNGDFAENYYHRGVDYAIGTGSPIVAPAAGRVALVGRVADGFELHGNTVGIDHGQGVLSIFIHMNGINVQEGQMVQAGETIGTVGSTGSSTGPHLHWGIYVNGVAVDPVPWRETGF